VWKVLYRHLEQVLLDRGLRPISAQPERARLEQFFLKSWTSGSNQTIASALQRLSEES
jgi:hypothetical protein